MTRDNGSLSRRSVLKQTTTGISALGVTTVAGCLGGGGDEGEIEITMASSYEPSHPTVLAAERFDELVQEESDGEITVDLVAGGAYGGEEEISDLVREGSVDAHADSRWPYMMYVPEFTFVNVPIVFDDHEHLVRATDSSEFEPAEEGIQQDGNQRRLGEWIYRGLRHFTSNAPVEHPDDVQGVTLRLPPIEEWVAIWEEIGAAPTSVALDELYSGLETGVVDASEGDIPQIHSENLQEVQSHLSMTGHHVQTGALFLNESVYQDFDETTQEIISEAAEEATLEISDQTREEEEDLLQQLEDEGMTIVEDVDQEAFRDIAEPVVEDLFENWEGDWEDWREI